MGGTLPLVVRAARPDDASVGRVSGWLYAANTAGGIAGTFVTGFVLAPRLGLVRTVARTYVTDRSSLERFAGDAAPVTNDRPRLEYGGWGRPGEFDRVMSHVFWVRQDPPLLGAETPLRQAIDTERRILMTFYQAALHHHAGERDQMPLRMAQVMRADPDNPYYRWFIGR